MRRWVLAVIAFGLAGCSTGDGSDGGADDGAEAVAADDLDPERRGPQGRVPQFVVHCEVSHIAFDDPIVLPWQPGKSHQHQFFGNVDVDADPGYERVIGADTTCDQRLDTASYWAPTLLDADGRRIDAVSMTSYYRPGDGVDHREVVAYPPGFMMLADDGSAVDGQPTAIVAWGCGSGAQREDRPPACRSGTTLRQWITFPDCWDGDRLTAFGSGAHVRYSVDGCPSSHPVALPQLTMAIDYPAVVPDGLALSSGDLDSAHADFWNTWDQAKLEREVESCLNAGLVCGLG